LGHAIADNADDQRVALHVKVPRMPAQLAWPAIKTAGETLAHADTGCTRDEMITLLDTAVITGVTLPAPYRRRCGSP
jgi:hypothetical protein